ncbi:MAG: glycoside hydrolase family 127 protein [Anaerolineaceae bacterium]|nr:glycoside hydrolase family 127 protein [Anaerolineaceae bacterium]
MKTTQITSGFWKSRLETNANSSIFHQWEQLEASGCIENFRIAAGTSQRFREGWFFADSDAYKWLDAASRIFNLNQDVELFSIMNDFIDLIASTQEPDGYIFTYNQIHFSGTRWINLQIEHELYCLGHLIEAGIAHFEATGTYKLLNLSIKAADRIVSDFAGKDSRFTPGHQEIEIALIRLHGIINEPAYLNVAAQFIEMRGKNPFFGLSIIPQFNSVGSRTRSVAQNKQIFFKNNAEIRSYQVPPGNQAIKPWNSIMRWYFNAFTGKYFQQHSPIRKQTTPVGHSVRFAYLQTAVAMLANHSKDLTLLPALEKAWDHMVMRRMYITGGIGSLPDMEGFGRDFELNPEVAYTETCAALGSMFWNWEMFLLTSKAKYSILFEWQLYNAAAVGMGSDGDTYLYNNPLECKGNITRQAWYEIPCCPSNLSRTWADLGKYISSTNENSLFIHQYIDCIVNNDLAKLEITSNLPWNGQTTIKVSPQQDQSNFSIRLRIPSWSYSSEVQVNGNIYPISGTSSVDSVPASGFDPRKSRWQTIERNWCSGDIINIEFDHSIRLLSAHPKVKGHENKVTVTRGPLVYCLESIDNPNDIFSCILEPESFSEIFLPDLMGGYIQLRAKTIDNQDLVFIPYHLWGNRGPSQMTVWVHTRKE